MSDDKKDKTLAKKLGKGASEGDPVDVDDPGVGNRPNQQAANTGFSLQSVLGNISPQSPLIETAVAALSNSGDFMPAAARTAVQHATR